MIKNKFLVLVVIAVIAVILIISFVFGGNNDDAYYRVSKTQKSEKWLVKLEVIGNCATVTAEPRKNVKIDAESVTLGYIWMPEGTNIKYYESTLGFESYEKIEPDDYYTASKSTMLAGKTTLKNYVPGRLKKLVEKPKTETDIEIFIRLDQQLDETFRFD
ncbi:MAG: hypothetical protein K9L17_06700 [Clostridiales bacterium]|nr:hypothetical protein [Clostridiales bacterium]MCF8022361.1 hypothetical protein [Clostridiales bacterium]